MKIQLSYDGYLAQQTNRWILYRLATGTLKAAVISQIFIIKLKKTQSNALLYGIGFYV